MKLNLTISIDIDDVPALSEFLKSLESTPRIEDVEEAPKPKAKAKRKARKKPMSMATPEAKADIAAEAEKQKPTLSRDELRSFIGEAIDKLGDEQVREVFSDMGIAKFSEITDEMVNPIHESLLGRVQVANEEN